MSSSPTAVRILVVDDAVDEDGLGNVLSLAFDGEPEFEVVAVSSFEAGLQRAAAEIFDIFVIDVHLQETTRGYHLAERLRSRGLQQPIILTTNNVNELNEPISKYASVLQQGPTYFVHRRKARIAEVVRDASNRLDFLVRTLSIMKRSGVHFGAVVVDGQRFDDSALYAAVLQQEDDEARHALQQTRRWLSDSLASILLKQVERGR